MLNPSFKRRLHYLTGVVTGLSADEALSPTATPLVAEYLGLDVDVRAMMAKCGMLDENSPDLDSEVHRRLGPSSRLLKIDPADD